jgi:hypothetical protein
MMGLFSGMELFKSSVEFDKRAGLIQWRDRHRIIKVLAFLKSTFNIQSQNIAGCWSAFGSALEFISR